MTEPGFWVKPVDEIPVVPSDDPEDPVWFPLQHHFGFTAFGANVYRACEAGAGLIGEHDESDSEQEELYLVVSGAARFTLAGEELSAPAGSVVAVTDPGVKRAAVAVEPGTTLVVVGAPRTAGFASSWRSEHFEPVPTVQG